jgi:hypothetical protein
MPDFTDPVVDVYLVSQRATLIVAVFLVAVVVFSLHKLKTERQ